MSDRHDEHELLALIEGELPAPEAQRLRERLAAADARLLAAVDCMRADRDALRRAPEPALPEDFLAEVEPVLARPMLIPPPDEVRRRHRRRQAGQKGVAPLLLAAAAVALVAGAGLWATLFLLGRPAAPPPATLGTSGAAERLAQRNDESAPPVVAPTPAGPPQPAPVAPEMRAEGSVDPGAPRPPAPRAKKPTAAPPSAPVVATIALVIETDDQDEAERLLQEALAGLGPAATALVRNLDQAEADALTQQWHQARAGAGDRGAPPPVAGSTPGQPLRRGADPGPRSEVPALDRSILRSCQIAGPAELAPSYDQQLAFSGKGATHTVAVPAEKLAALLERLAGEGRPTSLRLLEGAADPGGQWDAYDDVRRAARELLESASGGVILLPVQVKTNQVSFSPTGR